MIEFLFDYVSPYAYLAATQLPAIAERRGVAIEAVPVVLGGLLGSTGSRGPAEVPARREYLIHDVTRLARALGVPIAPPPTHPFNPLAALRVTCAAPAAARWRLVEAIFRAAWVDARRIDDASVVAAIATEQGLDGAALAAAATTGEIKAALRAATDRAIARGAFGVPTIFAGDQLFWGVDSLHLLDRFLAGDDAPDEAELARWRALVPSALRR